MTDPAWPPELRAVLERSVTAEYASLTRAGSPVTVPTTPYVEPQRTTIDVSTGLTYPAKAERARRDPRVCLLFADPVGSGLERPPVVLVQGLATVRDLDLQGNTDRYVRLSTQKLPAATAGTPRFVLRRLPWYFARIWIEVTPLHMRWWPTRDLAEKPAEWHAPEGTAAPLSDPAPSGKQPSPWLDPPGPWHDGAAKTMRRLTLCDLTTVDANGFPVCLPVAEVELVAGGFRFAVGAGAPELSDGPGCVTLHTHDEVFTGQENRTFVGALRRERGGWRFQVERALAHWSLAGGRTRTSLSFLAKGRRLRPRLAREAQRRFQPVPTVRFGDEH